MKWISVTERLPDVKIHEEGDDDSVWSNWVLCANEYGAIVYACMYNHERKIWFGYGQYLNSTEKVTHWMPLPPTPDASLPSSSVTGEEWISLKEYEQKALQLLSEKPVIKMLVQNGLPFEKWGNNIHDLIDKELEATRELRVKMLGSVTGESEAIGMIKWIRENYEPEFGDGRHWEDILDEAETPISDKELYNLYKQSKK